MTTVKNIYDYINSVAPFDLQEEWDNAGFLTGDFRKEVKTVVMVLDPTKEACEFAAGLNADLLLTHHPVLFKGAKEIFKGSALYTLINHDIAHIAAHTNFDVADCGINFNLAKLLQLENVSKIDGSFLVTGDLPQAMSIDDLTQYVSDVLDCNGIRYTDTDRLIKTVALGGGACEEYIEIAEPCSDCFITGDLKYHQMLDAKERGYALISAGHFETENKPFLMLKDMLEKLFTDVEFIVAPVNNPILSI